VLINYLLGGWVKKGKRKWKSLAVDQVLNSTRPTSSWADEAEEQLEGDMFRQAIDPSILPTAPRASRGSDVDEAKVPHSGPFQAYMSNIPYDMNEDDLVSFFQDLNIKEVRLPKDDKGGGNRASKGYGYVEFEDRTSLIAALNLTQTMLKGRPIQIELSTNNDPGRSGSRPGGRSMMRDSMSSMGGGPDSSSSNWRSGPRQDGFGDRNFDRGSGGGGGYGGRRDYGGSGFGRDEPRSFRDEPRSFRDEPRSFRDEPRSFRDEPRSFGDRDRFRDERGGGGGFNRDDNRGFSDRGFGRDRDRNFRDDRDDRGFGGSPFNSRGFDDRKDRDGGGSGRYQPRRDMGSFDRPERNDRDSGGDEPRTRPKLVLLPKGTNPVPESAAPARSASIFGEAKPVDTSAKEREIEERLRRNEGLSGDKSKGLPSRGGPREKEGGGRLDRDRDGSGSEKKESAWGRKGPSSINNGRETPEEDNHRPASPEKEWSRGQPPDNRHSEKGKGGSGSIQKGGSDRGRPRDSEKQSHKVREPRGSIEDIDKMPKLQESKGPVFAVSSKFSALGTEDDVVND